MQYVIIRPLTSVIAIVTEALGVYQEGNWSFSYSFVYCAIINNISFTISLYALFAFYIGVKDVLRPWSPILKFASVKIAIFFTFWQSILFALLLGVNAIPAFWILTPLEYSIVIQNCIICLEMGLIVAVMQ